MLISTRLIRPVVAVVCALALALLAQAEPVVFDLRCAPFTGNETRANVPTNPRLLGDRFEYWADDEVGQFYVAFAAPKEGLAGHTLHVSVMEKDAVTPLGEATIEASQAKAHFLVRVGVLKVGSYVAAATLHDAGGAAVGEPLRFAFTRTDKRREALAWPKAGLALTLPPQSDVPDIVWPTHAPLPLPIGLVRDVSELSLTEDGRPVAAQIVPVARWSAAPDASLQWVHVHFLARYRGGKPAAYVLHHKSSTPAVKTALDVQQDDKGIIVDTGTLKFVVNKQKFAGISQAWVDPSGQKRYDDAALVLQGETGGPYIVDGRLIRFDTQHAVESKVEVEEAGPVRVVIRAQGWYGSEEKRVGPICLYNTRIFAYAGEPIVRVQHHTILGYDTRLYRLADAGFTFATPKGARAGFGVDGQAFGGDLPQNGTVYLHQDRHDRLRVVGLNKEPMPGKRSDGWFTLQPAADAGAPGITLALRDVWQKFPKEVEFSRQGMTLHFWPAHGHRAYSPEEELALPEIYKFWCFHQHRLLDLDLPNDYFTALSGYPGTMENVPEHALNGNGQGLAIGNDFLVAFGDSAASRDPAGLARLHQENPSAIAPVAWNAGSQAMGNIAAADDPKYADVENAIEQSYLSYTRSVERGNTYGMWNYADVHTYWDVKNNHAELHRVWLNSHYHNAGKTWLLFFRSGSRDLLRWARASTDHYLNVDTVNWADYERDDRIKSHLPGAMYHCKGQTHWGGEAYGMRRRDTHAGLWGHWVDPDASLWSWYVDANLRGRDVYQMWHDSIRKYGLPIAGTRREINTSLAIACSLYEATWDADVLPNIHGMGLSLRTAEPLENQNPGPMWHPLWMNRYYDLTRDARYVPFILEHGQKEGIKDTWVVALGGLAYRISEDPKYLKLHFDRLLEMPRNFYHQDGDAYDWYGWGPGPLGSRWFWMGWPTYLKQLQRSGLSVSRQRIPAGGYPYSSARHNVFTLPASLTIYVLEPKDQPIDLTVVASSLGGDLHATSLQVLSPSGKALVQTERINSTGGASSVRHEQQLPADGETGVYRVEFRGHEANLAGPITSLLEGAVARADVEYRASRVYSFVHPMPAAAPITLTIRSASDGKPAHAVVFDAKGKTIAELSLFRPRPQSELVVQLDPAKHPLPWLVDVYGLASVKFTGAESLLMTPQAEAIKPLMQAVGK